MRERCPACGSEPVAEPGTRYTGRVGILWRKRSFEERLFRCAEGHVYSVREERRGREVVGRRAQAHDDVDDWLRTRTGEEPIKRPPGL